MSVLVKICGVRTVAVAQAAQKAGAQLLGFNFVPTSKRRLSVAMAQEIIQALQKRGRPTLVGVFQNAKLADVKKIVRTLGLDTVQLHGRETPAYAKKVGVPIIKAFALKSDFNVPALSKKLSQYPAKYFLLDRARRGKGEPLNPQNVALIANKFPIILAGGLNPDTVRKTITMSRALRGVDVVGGIETKGKPDPKKIRQFVREAKSAYSLYTGDLT